jgi:hypothetical protein
VLTPLGLLNFCLLQWFCFRLARVVDVETGRRISFALLGWPLPLTGWWTPYIFIGGRACIADLMRRP